MTHEHDKEACAVSFEELRKRALDEFKEGVGTYPADAAWALEKQLKKIDAAEKAAQERDEAARIATEARHDSAAIGQLYGKMHAKLAETRKNRGGWWTDGCTVEKLSQMLHAVVAKGDPVDVANYCAFIHAKGGKIAPMSAATEAGIKEMLGRTFQTMTSIPITDESGVSVGAGTSRLVPRMPAEVAGSAARRVEPEVQQLITDTVSGIGAASVPNMLPAGYLVGAAEFAGELLKARREFPVFRSAHEGLALIEEELEEMKEHVHAHPKRRDYAAFRKEAIQLGAMTLAMVLEVINPESRAS